MSKYCFCDNNHDDRWKFPFKMCLSLKFADKQDLDFIILDFQDFEKKIQSDFEIQKSGNHWSRQLTFLVNLLATQFFCYVCAVYFITFTECHSITSISFKYHRRCRKIRMYQLVLVCTVTKLYQASSTSNINCSKLIPTNLVPT